MKGILLCGGNGTRLRPLTLTTNKHLLPVHNKQMVYYPLQTMLDAGIKDILIVSGQEHAGHFVELLGSGSQFGASFTYKVQNQAGGIAQALGLAKTFIGNDDEPFLILLGDNIFEDKLNLEIKDKHQAKVFLKKVKDAYRFGVARFDYPHDIEFIEEKPKNQNEGYAVTGAYIYYKDVFDIIGRMKPSARGELEITDINNYYANLRILDYDILKGFWTDAGTFESLHRANSWAQAQEKIISSGQK